MLFTFVTGTFSLDRLWQLCQSRACVGIVSNLQPRHPLIMATGISRFALRFTAPASGLAVMTALAVLYHLEPQLYQNLLAFMGIVPFRYPFLDFQSILASIDCWQHGTDVYVTNP